MNAKQLTTVVEEMRSEIEELRNEIAQLKAQGGRRPAPRQNDVESIKAAMAAAREQAMRTGKCVKV